MYCKAYQNLKVQQYAIFNPVQSSLIIFADLIILDQSHVFHLFRSAVFIRDTCFVTEVEFARVLSIVCTR